jgi:hypothetical protein
VAAMRPFLLDMTREQRERLDRLAELERMPRGEIIRKLIEGATVLRGAEVKMEGKR